MSDRIDAIRDRLAKATPGPWKARGLESSTVVLDGSNKVLAQLGDPLSGYVWHAADLIANAPADLAWLIERVEAVQDALNRHPRVCDTHEPGAPITCGWKHAVADIENAMKEAPDGP